MRTRARTRPRPEVSQEDLVNMDEIASIAPSPLKDAIINPDLNIPGLLSKADRRSLRKVSKEFYHPVRKCLDADELKAMRSETVRDDTVRPCKNTARVMYNPEQGIQRALMCAIMSVDQELHVDVEEGHWNEFQENESVKCFDDNYARRWTPAQRRELLRRWLESALTSLDPGAGVWVLHLFFDGFSQTGARWRRLEMVTGGTVLLD